MDADDTPTPESDDHISLASRAEAFAELADLNDESDAGEAAGSAPDPDGAPETTGADVDVTPPVVAVVVVHDAGDWLDETLRSLGDQTYANLSVLVIDAASAIDPTPRVAEILPGAFVRRLESNVGYGPTTNEILELVSGASFFCLCHDDVALDPGAVHELVAEAFRSNAGIVGPKLVDWDEPDKLLSVGFTVDRSGGRAPYAEHHELDQGQHDAVRDVFAVNGGCTLVRADLFAHLDGFDPGIDLLGEDLDLCWRAHLVGARVVVAPRARVRHRQNLGERIDATGLARVEAAHRQRTVLTNYRFAHLLGLVPLLVVVSIIEAIIEAAIGRRDHARAQLAAWGTSLRSAPAIWRSRRRVRAIRERSDRSIAQLQTKTWARLDGLIQAHRRARAGEVLDADALSGEDAQLGGDIDDAERDSFVRTGAARRAYSLVTWGVVGVVAVVLIGTRELFIGPLPAIGSFAHPPDSLGDLWRIWTGTWNPAGLGSSQSPSSGTGLLAIGGSIFGGAFGFLRRVAILAPVPIGLFGMWRLARPLGSRRAQLVALVLYAAVPVPWNALSRGNWSGLLVYAVAPWLLGCAFRALRARPFGPGRSRGSGLDADAPDPRWFSPVLGWGLLLAVTGALVPAVALVAVVVALSLVVANLLLGRFTGSLRLVLTTAGAILVAAVLLGPWVLVGPGRSTWTMAGIGGGTQGWLRLDEILRFQSGPMGSGILGFAFVVAATLPLLIGRSWRFAWGVRAWAVALACFGVVWLGQTEWFNVPLPPPAVFLAPAAAALGLAVACGAAAVEVDLPTFRFGGAQVASVVATLVLVLGTFPTIGNAADGRWRMAPLGLDQALEFISTERAETPFRVLWVGDPAVMPVAGWHLDDATAVGVTDHGMPRLHELWAPADPEGSGALLDALEMATSGETTRLGRILTDMDVRYIVLPRQLVPLPYRTGSHEPAPELLRGLEDQLDLARESINDAVVVYRNEAWDGGRRLFPPDLEPGVSVGDALDAPDSQRVEGSVDADGTSRFTIPEAGILATGQPVDSSWRLRVDGERVEPVTLWGWEQGFEVTGPGRAELTRTDGWQRPVVLAVIALLWLGAVAAWVAGRRGRAEDLLVEVAAEDVGDDAGSLVRLGPEGAPAAAAEEVAEVRVGEAEDSDDPAADGPETHGPAGAVDEDGDTSGDANRTDDGADS